MEDPAFTIRRVSQAIELAQAASELPSRQEMLTFLTVHVHEIIPCETAALNECDLTTGEIVVTAMDDQPTSFPLPVGLNHRHVPLPLLTRFEVTRRLDSARLSDVVPINWRDTPSYNEVFRPMGAEYQAGVGLAYQDPIMWAVAMNRPSVDFSDTDLTLLNVLGSVLRSSLVAHIERQRLEDLLHSHSAAQGLITFDSDWDRVLDLQPAARELLDGSDFDTTAPSFTRKLSDLAKALEPLTPVRVGNLEFVRLAQTDARIGNLLLRRLEQSGALTARQHEILELISQGQSPKEIAQILEISRRTVETHIRNAYTRLKVNNRVQAVNRARIRSTAVY